MFSLPCRPPPRSFLDWTPLKKPTMMSTNILATMICVCYYSPCAACFVSQLTTSSSTISLVKRVWLFVFGCLFFFFAANVDVDDEDDDNCECFPPSHNTVSSLQEMVIIVVSTVNTFSGAHVDSFVGKSVCRLVSIEKTLLFDKE